ncbi:MAG: hypothetical protein IJ057_06360 [Bacteroidales bacterium]|nr:hypothetical protein [Bacteroidales bacterium]
MNSLKISDIPTLANWIEESPLPNDSTIDAFISDLSEGVCELVWVSATHPHLCDNSPREDKIIVSATQKMALILGDLIKIRDEVEAHRTV